MKFSGAKIVNISTTCKDKPSQSLNFLFNLLIINSVQYRSTFSRCRWGVGRCRQGVGGKKN